MVDVWFYNFFDWDVYADHANPIYLPSVLASHEVLFKGYWPIYNIFNGVLFLILIGMGKVANVSSTKLELSAGSPWAYEYKVKRDSKIY